MTNEQLTQLPIEELQAQLLEEKDTQKIKEIVDIFNVNIKKKETIRATALSDIQDKILKQIDARMQKPDNFSNSDLINYFKVVNESLTKSTESLDTLNIPQIQINQQINIKEDGLNRESRKKVLDVVDAILKSSQGDVVDCHLSEIEEENSIK